VRARAAVAVAALSFALVTTTAVLLILTARQRFEKELEKDALLFASLATRPICESYEVYFESGFYKFRQFVDGLLEQAPDIEGIEILDVEGRVLFDSRRRGERPPRDEVEAGVDTSRLGTVRSLQPHVRHVEGPTRALEIVHPFLEDWGRHRLSVAFHFSHANLDEQLRRYAATTLGLALASLLLAGVVGYALASRITRPLEALTLGARRLADGDLDHRLHVRTGDEIEVLADTLDEMAGRLQATFRDLEQRNAELERFTYTVSHDLRSPLVTVSGFLGMLEKDLRGGRTDRAREDIGRIHSAIATMDRLLRELLELSRVGLIADRPERVPVEPLVREAAQIVAGRLADRPIRLFVHPGLPDVYGDPARLREVFQNLLDNAAKFMGDQSEPRIEVGWRPGASSPVLYVRDNGIGIDPRYHEKVFGLFDRLDQSVDGTGLGLALVKRIVETHGGKVWVESEGAGRGATFCIALPPGPPAEDELVRDQSVAGPERRP
jgi:signal transduction histidine kinase